MIPSMGKTVCCVLAFFYFRDFAIVNINLSSNFVIEHFRRTYFQQCYIYIYKNTKTK